MKDVIVISRSISVSSRPLVVEELARLHSAGIRTVVDLRVPEDIAPGLLSHQGEERAVRACGMDYAGLPVPSDFIDTELLDKFGETVALAAKPVLVHCTDGRRAGLLSVIQAAIDSGAPGEHMLQMARQLDAQPDSPDLQRFLAEYVDRHELRADPMRRRQEAARGKGRPEPLLPALYPPASNELGQGHGILQPDVTPPAAPSPSGAGWVASPPRRRRLSRQRRRHPRQERRGWRRRPSVAGTADRWSPAPFKMALTLTAASLAIWIGRRHPLLVLFALGFAAQRAYGALTRSDAPPALAPSPREDEVSRLQRELDRLSATA